MEYFVQAVSYFLLGYLVIMQTIAIILTIAGWRGVHDHARRRPQRDYNFVSKSPMTLPISILVPGYNEENTICQSVRSLLESQFLTFEVVVVNDGSKDDTVKNMVEVYDMVKVNRIPRSGIPTVHVKDIYVSRSEPNVILLDKENGGKADALNAAINYANYPLVCSLDADTMLDKDALARLVWEFQAYPQTVAVGGIVRIINGSKLKGGKLVDIRMPTNWLAKLQIIEYLRAFWAARIGWSSFKMLLIISGAFGLFRREALIQINGYNADTVGEDAELIVRLHRYSKEHGTDARITFFPDPICWTEAPEDWKVLKRQRDRWQRGLAELLWTHKDMMFKKKYGRIGFMALPYFWLFELLSPLIEVSGYIILVIGLLLGYIWLPMALLLMALTTLLGVTMSYAVVLMEEYAFSRYPSWRDLRTLLVAGIAENFGYRQMLAIVRLKAFWTLYRDTGGWGEMTRKGFSEAEETNG